MSWFIAILSTIVFVETLVRIPIIPRCKSLGGLVSKILSTLRSKNISDHWKEKALPQYALLLGGHSLALFMWLLLCLMPGIGIILLSELMGVQVYARLISVEGIVACTLAGTLYAMGRNRIKNAHAKQ